MVQIVRVTNRSGLVFYAIQRTVRRWFFKSVTYLDLVDASFGQYNWRDQPDNFSDFSLTTDLKVVINLFNALSTPLYKIESINLTDLEKTIYES